MNESWAVFGKHIHQDFLIDHPDFFSGLPFVWKNVPHSLRQEFIISLRQVLSSGARGPALAKLWRDSGAQIFVPDHQIKNFLQQVLVKIEAEDWHKPMDSGNIK